MLNKKKLAHIKSEQNRAREKTDDGRSKEENTPKMYSLTDFNGFGCFFFSFMESSLLICFEYYDYYFINILTFFGAYRESKQLTKRRKRCGQPKPQKRRKDDNEKEFVNKYKIHSKDKKNNQQQ